MKVTGTPFVQHGEEGDFKWMRQQDKYRNTLFLFNENVVDSYNDQPLAGAGSAAIRPYTHRFKEKPRAAGIPTGWSVASRGFTTFDFLTKKIIDWSLERIRTILHNDPEIDQIIFSCSSDDPTRIGTSIFQLPEKIVSYISDGIAALANDSGDDIKSHETLNRLEANLAAHAFLHEELAEYKLQQQKRERPNNGYGVMPVKNRMRSSYF